jgi:hypothetical protein
MRTGKGNAIGFRCPARAGILCLALLCWGAASWLAGCSGAEGQADSGVEEPDAAGDAGIDAGGDAGADAGTDAGKDAGGDAGFDAGVDAGGDPGADGGPDSGGDAGNDGGATPWPPENPWWGRKQCLLPACDRGIAPSLDVSGRWTHTLTALSHDCNTYIETMKPEIKPGAVTTQRDQSMVQTGECVSETSGGTITGVIKGNVLINCMVRPPENGVTAMPTGWIEFDSANHGTGESTVWLFDIPIIQPSDCSVRYRVEFTRQ